MVKLYPDTGRGLPLRVLSDSAVILWTLAWIAAGLAVHAAVETLQVVSSGLNGAGTTFNQLIAALTAAIPRGIPGLSSFLAAQAEALKHLSGDQLIAGAHQIHDGIDRLALLLSLLIALPPILTVLIGYLQWRIRDAREMGAALAFVLAAQRAGRLEQAHAALAFRALSTLSFTELMRASDDPVGDLAAHRYDRLAAAMMKRAGMRPRGAGGSRLRPPLPLPAASEIGAGGEQEDEERSSGHQ